VVTRAEGRHDRAEGRHDLVVIGASAGGVEALRRVVAGLPADLAATVCIVLHMAPSTPSALPHILQRSSVMRCRSAQNDDPLEPGQILVAPPDRHLVVEDSHVCLSVGPRENGHRPAVDALFRSAAAARGERVIGVVLSGTRDDGAAGLAVIKASGGAAVVQDPAEAMYAGMPRSALASTQVDAVVSSDRVAEVVIAMVNGDRLPPDSRPPDDPPPADAAVRAFGAAAAQQPLTTICPECGGVLTERHGHGVVQWECRVGHRYSPDSLLNAQGEDVEAAMWAAVRALEDRRLLLERMAQQFDAQAQPRSARSVRRRAGEAAKQAQVLREALASAALSSLAELSDPERQLDQLQESEEGLAS
jgi:two-component system chemotaxis response regulator CheB